MGGHHKHFGDIVRVDNTDFARVQAHIRRIDQQQSIRAQFTNRDHIVFRGGAAVDNNPVALWGGLAFLGK
ncbi:hypothetical protein D3C81_2260300 [compost metagenome]